MPYSSQHWLGAEGIYLSVSPFLESEPLAKTRGWRLELQPPLAGTCQITLDWFLSLLLSPVLQCPTPDFPAILSILCLPREFIFNITRDHLLLTKRQPEKIFAYPVPKSFPMRVWQGFSLLKSGSEMPPLPEETRVCTDLRRAPAKKPP